MTSEIKSEWKVMSNTINGERMYVVYRLIDKNAVDHSGNREYFGCYVTDHEYAEFTADRLNKQEEVANEEPQETGSSRDQSGADMQSDRPDYTNCCSDGDDINRKFHGMTINDLVTRAHSNAKAHGWHEPERTFGELIALCHSELSEALEEYRNGREPTDCYYICYKCEKGPCALNSEYGADEYTCNPTPSAKPEGIAVELADVVIRIADMCGLYGIDLEEAIADKMAYNEKRPMRHGGKVI